MADSTIDEIKRRVDIVDLISQTVQLKRAGRSFKGLCPFHGEKTPSFTVSPERGTWHCFGCGEGGDAFTFLQKRENLDFPEALRTLADRAGVELERGGPARPNPAEREKRERGHQVLESAALFYRAALLGTQGAATREYLAERGVADETAERFGLGYAEPTGRALERHLAQAGYPREEAVAAGALGQADDGRTYDRFRERLIFPIRNAEGQMIGFGGRALKPDQQPKYLNSPQTELFDKGANLYALDQARHEIRQAGRAVVVEGYMDALVPHQHGFRNVVATLGTAITERHIQTLRRLTSEVVLALDADAAGVKAAIRGFGVASEALEDETPTVMRVRGLGRFLGDRRTQIKAMLLPPGRDPDEVVREDPAFWDRLTRNALPVVDFVLQTLGQRHDLAEREGRREAADESLAVIRDLRDPIEQAHYIQRLAGVLGLREDDLRVRLSQQAAETRPRRHVALVPELPEEPPRKRTPEERLEDLVLALFLRAPTAGAGLEPGDFESAARRAIFERLLRRGPWPDSATALEWLGAEMGPSFEQEIGGLRAVDEENARLAPDELAKELRVRALELRKQRHLRHYQALDIALREETDRLSADEQRQYRQRLAQVATLLGAVFAEQRQLGVVGTMSWSVRRGQEVLGG